MSIPVNFMPGILSNIPPCSEFEAAAAANTGLSPLATLSPLIRRLKKSPTARTLVRVLRRQLSVTSKKAAYRLRDIWEIGVGNFISQLLGVGMLVFISTDTLVCLVFPDRTYFDLK